METLFQFVSPPSQCGYLADQNWQLEYELVQQLSPAEYLERLRQGWRRFGNALFRPRCQACSACQSLRVLVGRFRPNRSQRRVHKTNQSLIRLHIGRPSVSRAKLDLYDHYHAFQSEMKGWPDHEPKDAESYINSFADNPFPTQEWCFYRGNQLVGVGYVDDLPGGLSAIYFFYDPDQRRLSLGIWNVLSIIDYARSGNIPHVYLGYYVKGCPSMEYKSRFVPNQILGPNGQWHDFQTEF
jgi:leucyl-tRNA---protein transferase